MKVSILQISDIHLTQNEVENHGLEKISKVIPAIKSECADVEQIFVVVSGDIAYSGREDEYLLAMEALEKLKDDIKLETMIDPEFIIIPGNHDCNFNYPNKSIRGILVNNIKQGRESIDELDSTVVDQCCGVQEAYRDFLKLYDVPENIVYVDSLLTVSSFNQNGVRIIFNRFNTSWISELHEKPGTMAFPIEKYKKVLQEFRGDFVITVLHHPYNWLNPINARKMKDIIERYSDIVFTGHEHVTTMSRKDNLKGDYVQYIEGGVFQERYDGEMSEFNLLSLDLKSNHQKLYQFSWNEAMYRRRSETDWIEIKRAKDSKRSVFELNADFVNFLNDPGVTLNHPRKPSLNLEDIFIFPDAKITNRTDKEPLNQFVNLESLKKIDTVNKYFIIGEEKSGRSTLCKVLYKHFYESGYVPVWVDLSALARSSREDFTKHLLHSYKQQYSNETIEHFQQLDENKKVVIVDNFDKSKLNNASRYALIQTLDRLYSHIILTGNELLQFTDLFGTSGNEGINSTFRKLELVEFGHKSRADLINKWNNLGREETIEEDDLIKENDRIDSIVSTIIGNNYVPAYPFFLLIIIQTIESGIPHNLKESSYGYYYDYLITQSIMKANIRHEEIDAFYSYVTQLAFRFYESKITEISTDEFKQFHIWFCHEYDVQSDFEVRVDRLVLASIMEKNMGGYYRFKYPYVYYYFVAKYFSINIGDEGIKSIISFMSTKIHIREYANIVMFLTHMSKDPFILKEILAQAKSIFSEFSPAKLEKDISIFNSLIDDIPKIVYEAVEVKEHRKQVLIAQDEIDRMKQEVATELEETPDEFDELDVVAKLNSAFKTIEILGQILKNYYGSIIGSDKYDLCLEAYNLGLRSLSSFLTALSKDIDSVVKELQGILEERKIVGSNKKHVDKIKVDRVARRFMFNLIYMISFVFIKKISGAVGTDNLTETFRKILENNDSIANRLIDTSVKLDHLHMIPFHELTVLKERTKTNTLAYTLEKGLMVHYLYMFNTSYRDKHKISTLLDIPMTRQYTIDKSSQLKKSDQ